MRIAFVNSTRRWGGNKTWCIDLGIEALSLGHQAFIYGRDVRFIDKAKFYGMETYQVSFGPDFNPLCIAWFCRQFRARKISHVVVNVGKELRTAGIAARLCGLPLAMQVGAPDDFSNTLTRHLIHKALSPNYFFCSNFAQTGLQQRVPFMQQASCTTIFPGTFIPAEGPMPASQPYTLITTSQLNANKRHEDLLRAIPLLLAQNLHLKLRIVGTGENEAQLKALSHDLGLDNVVEFTGHSQNVTEELRNAQIFVLPTQAEPLGIALEEAMAHGLFPVARRSGGVQEIWPPKFDAHLIPPQAGPEEFAQALAELLRCPPQQLDAWRTEVQEHARQTFERKAQFLKFADFLQKIG